ncbi:putative pleiotropic regulator 1 isoform X1 [Apostichopus japonicus]|uniref:Pleiotropic regulator 1 n=1 Tax=Stichopus japonicus TaxID=307972 RepID=A0A2G8KPE9_STIJA|nr:putative pleiotropic regulator 1 isoform X1 [Apostichopus japonicus]
MPQLKIKIKLSCKAKDQYGPIMDLPETKREMRKQNMQQQQQLEAQPTGHYDYNDIPTQIEGGYPYPNAPGVELSDRSAVNHPPLNQGSVNNVMNNFPDTPQPQTAYGVNDIKQHAGIPERALPPSQALIAVSDKTKNSQALMPRKAPTMPKPKWHPPWKLYRVISGHIGWVRSLAIEPANQWFVSGSNDRTIKIWDLASGTLKLSLTGHVSAVRGLAVSKRHPYLFSAGEDKMVKCWDLEQNKVIRHYHGHLSACFDLALHPTIDILATCGRDSSIRIWDMRTKACIHTLTGHTNTVASIQCQSSEPQIVSGSHDATIRLWDLAAGKSRATLTNHKKGVRSVVLHPKLYMMASASPDNIKQWRFPEGNFTQNLSGHNAIINCLAVNADGVLVSGGDNGTIHLWDWKTAITSKDTGACPAGSIDSESGIFAMKFDNSGSRL